MTIITGANGFIGSMVVLEYNQKGYSSLVVTDKVSPTERPGPLSHRQFSQFMSPKELLNYLASFSQFHPPSSIEWVIHMGANSSTTATDWNELYENNTLYTQKLFEWCTKFQIPLIYASSAATYGAGENGYDDHFRNDLLKPLNLYGKSKWIFDQWALHQDKTPPHWYGLKFFNVFGPNEYHKENMTSVVYKSFFQIQTHQSVQLFKSYHPEYTDGNQKRDFIYIKDITRWILELTQKKPKNGIYNMGFGNARTWNDLAMASFQAQSIRPQIQYIEMPEALRGQYQYYTQASMEKWESQGMSKPIWPLEKAIEDYTQNYLLKEDPWA